MNQDEVMKLATDALMLAFKVGLPLLLAGLVVGLLVDLQHPGVPAARRQLQHGVEGDRDVDLGAGGQARRPPGLELTARPDLLSPVRAGLDDRVPVFVQQLERERDLLVRPLPRDVEQHRDPAGDRARSADRPAAAGDEQLAVGDLRVVSQHHRDPHGSVTPQAA